MKQETKTKELPKAFNYNAKLMSLTKQKIIHTNNCLYETINTMQKDIDLLKQKNNELNSKLIETTNKLNKSLKQQIFYLDESTKYVKQNTILLKELFFLKNRNLFQRIFNVQYKK